MVAIKYPKSHQKQKTSCASSILIFYYIIWLYGIHIPSIPALFPKNVWNFTSNTCLTHWKYLYTQPTLAVYVILIHIQLTRAAQGLNTNYKHPSHLICIGFVYHLYTNSSLGCMGLKYFLYTPVSFDYTCFIYCLYAPSSMWV